MKRGEIYLGNLDPVVGYEVSKTRPVLIISNDINNEFSQTVSILPITSSIDKIYPFEVLIFKNDSNLQFDSKIKANQIRTIDKQRLINYIGKLSPTLLLQVEKALSIHLGLSH